MIFRSLRIVEHAKRVVHRAHGPKRDRAFLVYYRVARATIPAQAPRGKWRPIVPGRRVTVLLPSAVEVRPFGNYAEETLQILGVYRLGQMMIEPRFSAFFTIFLLAKTGHGDENRCWGM